MTWPAVFRRHFQTDLAAAYDWYEQQRAGLGEEFLGSVLATLGSGREIGGHHGRRRDRGKRDDWPCSRACVPLRSFRVATAVAGEPGVDVVRYTIAVLTIRTPNELAEAAEALQNDWFRGQGFKSWPLQSTLERDAERFGVARSRLVEREKTMLELFRERAHLFGTDSVKPESMFEWHALIRHFGGPSRLLDVTSSLFVAACFAMSAAPHRRDAAVWAFRPASDYGENPRPPDEWFESDSASGVTIAKPSRLNDRLSAQSGAFLVPRSLAVPLHQQVVEAFDTDINAKAKRYRSVESIRTATGHRIWKLIIPHGEHGRLLSFLSSCNVRSYVLFPGLDGLALSLREMLRSSA